MAEVAPNVHDAAKQDHVSPVKGGDGFDQKLKEQEILMDHAAQGEDAGTFLDEDDMHDNNDPDVARIKSTQIFKYNEEYLHCPALEHDPAFAKLKKKVL